MTVNTTPDHWEQVAQEWRDAGQHLKTFGETLMQAFQSGWDSDRADAEFAKRTDEMRATAKRLEAALRAAREAAAAQPSHLELAEARTRSVKAAEDIQRMIAGALQTFSEALGQLAQRADTWRSRHTSKSTN